MTIAMDSSGSWKLVDQFNRVAVCEVGKQLLIGRDGCDVLLKSKSVEPRHAVVEFDETDNCLMVKDLDTQNGTFVNEQRIPKATAARLGAGDRIRFGYDSVVYHVEYVEENSQTARVLQSQEPAVDARKVSEVSNSPVLSNGVPTGSPVQSRRRSVQDPVSVEPKPETEKLQAEEMEDSRGPVGLFLTTNNNLPAKDFLAHTEESKDSEEEKGQVEVLEKNQEEQEKEVEEDATKITISRPSQAFTIDFDALPASPAVSPRIVNKTAELQGQRESVPQTGTVQDPLSSRLPDRLRRSLREREEKAKERVNGAVKANGGPALTDNRKRSSSSTRPTQSTIRSRQRSTSKGRQSSQDRNGEESHRMGMPGRSSVSRSSSSASQSRTDAPVSKPGVRKPRSGAPSTAPLKSVNDGKNYLIDRMLGSPGQSARGRGVDARKTARTVQHHDTKPDVPDAAPVDGENDSTPSEAGTYTIENEKSANKSKESLFESNTDTSGPLHDTQEALVALEKQFHQNSSRDDLDSEMKAIEHKQRRPSQHQLQQKNGELMYNVLCPTRPNRRTPSEQADSGPPKRDGSAVRRSNSDSQKSRPPPTRRNTSSSLNHNQDGNDGGRGRTPSSTTTSVAARRRMSTGNSGEASAAASSSGRESATSGRKATGALQKSTTDITRFDYGRHSLKSQSAQSVQRSPRNQQKQSVKGEAEKKAEAREALNRRKGYDPRKAAMENRTTRKGNTSESEGQASPNERPRRTSSADARPMTEMTTESRRGSQNHPAVRRGSGVRRHESLNSGRGMTRMTPRSSAGVVPNTGALLPSRAPASAFLDVRSPCNQRSQSVSNAETSEVAYDLLLVSSIHVMTSKLRRGFDELLIKLRENRVLTRTPTPIHELFQSKPPAHLNSTNAELKEALADLRLIECGLQTLDSHLVPSASEGAVSARTTTLGSCTENQYKQELRRITTEYMSFRPISADDSDSDGEPPALMTGEPNANPSQPIHPIVQIPLPRRLESSF